MQRAKFTLILTILVALTMGFLVLEANAACTTVTGGTKATTTSITAPGNYCLGSDLTYNGTGHAIDITSNDVIFDLSGYKIAAGTPGSTYGIYSTNSDVRIKNGTIDNFWWAVVWWQSNSIGVIIEDMRITNFAGNGIKFACGTGSCNSITIRNNVIAAASGSGAYGINVGSLTNSRVINNDIAEAGFGIYVTGNGGANVVDGNRISAASSLGTTGIEASPTTPNTLVLNNRLQNMDTGITGGSGIFYQNNIVFGGSSTHYDQTMIDGGNNK